MEIIPLPVEHEVLPGSFRFSSETSLLTDATNRWNAGYLQSLLAVPTGFPMRIRNEAETPDNTIRLRASSDLAYLGREGYYLTVTPKCILIEAPSPAGVFYGIQSLRQLLPAEIEERRLCASVNWDIPCQKLVDRPRFAWRGFMLDEGRHFQGMNTVLQILDLMALQKLNVFHWHLTEDQGWRIEIKKYPRLTEFGSKRPGTSKTILGKKHNGIPHGGYYTQGEIRAIVAYAAERQISVVPEIEIPGHCTAALASYPHLSCTGGPFEVATHFGIYPDIYCAGKEAVFTFLQDVLDEMLDLFPSPYIHIGGDEAPKKRWSKCPDCQRRLKEEHLQDEHALQGYFTNRILKYLEAKGRHGIGWNEILQEGLVEGPIVQYWVRGHQALVEAIRNHRQPVVMSTYLDTYLDHGYSLMPLSRAYKYDPIMAELNEKEAVSILGLEFPLWTEWVPDRARLDYQVYPRMAALAETGWTAKEKKNLDDFLMRLEKFLTRLDKLGVSYAPLKDVEPSLIKQLFGIFTIAIPQKRTAKR
jgi:hexosaminidase